MKVILRFDDIDFHCENCICDECNDKGEAYGIAIISKEDVIIKRIYAPSDDAVFEKSLAFCQENSYEVIEDNRDNVTIEI